MLQQRGPRGHIPPPPRHQPGPPPFQHQQPHFDGGMPMKPQHQQQQQPWGPPQPPPPAMSMPPMHHQQHQQQQRDVSSPYDPPPLVEDPRRQRVLNAPPPQQHHQPRPMPGPRPMFEAQRFPHDPPRPMHHHVPPNGVTGDVPSLHYPPPPQQPRPPPQHQQQQQTFYPPPPPTPAPVAPYGGHHPVPPPSDPRRPAANLNNFAPPHGLPPPSAALSPLLPPPSSPAPPSHPPPPSSRGASDPRLTGQKRPRPGPAPPQHQQQQQPLNHGPPAEGWMMGRGQAVGDAQNRARFDFGPDEMDVGSGRGEGGRGGGRGGRRGGRGGERGGEDPRRRQGRGGRDDESRDQRGRGGRSSSNARDDQQQPARRDEPPAVRRPPQPPRVTPAFPDLVAAVVDVLGGHVATPERFTRQQIDAALARLPADVSRLRPQWDSPPQQIVAVGRELVSKNGPAWDVLQEKQRRTGPTTAGPAGPPPPGFSEKEQVEVLVPLVRTAYSDHYRIINDPATPPRVRSVLDFTQAPPDFPLFRGLSPAMRERVLREGLRPFMSASMKEEVTLGPNGEVEVSTELVRLLYRLLFMGEVSVSCSNPQQASLVNTINSLVKETGRELASLNSREYLNKLVEGTPLDVVTFYRKDILKRLQDMVAELDTNRWSACDYLGQLRNVLELLARPDLQLWDARRAEELHSLQARVAALSAQPVAPPVPSSRPDPRTPPHVYEPTAALHMSPVMEGGDFDLQHAVLDMSMDSISSPVVSPPASPVRQPRDPRRVKRVRFNEDAMETKGDPEHVTYVKSHHYEEQEHGLLAAFCTNPRCKRTDWERRCHRCGRCGDCSKVIFCKGAEKMVTGQATAKLHDRMDKAIWEAFRNKDFHPMLALILNCGVSVNFRRVSKGETALMAAAYNGDMKVCEQLLELGADPHAKTEDGMTAWTFASRYQHNAIANLIQDYITGKRKPLVVPAPVAVVDPPEPLLVSPTVSISVDGDDAPMAEGLVLINHGDDSHPFEGGGDSDEDRGYSPNDPFLALMKEEEKQRQRGQDGDQASQAKRARTR